MGKKRVPKAWKTLGVLLLALEGYEVVLELKTDVTVLGVVDEADAGMSCTLTSAQLTHPDGRVETMDQIYVSGRSVRYVHIPDSVNIVHVLARYKSNTEKNAKRYSRGVRRGRQRVVRRKSGGAGSGN